MKKSLRFSLLVATFGVTGFAGAHASVPTGHDERAPSVLRTLLPGVDVAVTRSAWGYSTPAKFSSLSTHGTEVAVTRSAWGYRTPAKFSSLQIHGTEVAVNRSAWGYGTPAKF